MNIHSSLKSFSADKRTASSQLIQRAMPASTAVATITLKIQNITKNMFLNSKLFQPKTRQDPQLSTKLTRKTLKKLGIPISHKHTSININGPFVLKIYRSMHKEHKLYNQNAQIINELPQTRV